MKTENNEHAGHALHLTIEGKGYEWNNQYITGSEVKRLAGIPDDAHLLLVIKGSFEDEHIANDTRVDLARPGIEHFRVRHKLKLTINRQPYQWGSQFITGAELRKLGGIPNGMDIFLDNKGGFEDEPIGGETRVDLARPGVEHFFTEERHEQFAIIVNGREKPWTERKITFEQVITLAFGTYVDNGQTIYTVTYKHGPVRNPECSMVRGDVVFVKNKMIFNATQTDKS